MAQGSDGEDAYFASDVACGAFGVADGVGGWGDDGVDSAAYARRLMAQSAHALEGAGPHRCSSVLAALEYAQVSRLAPGGWVVFSRLQGSYKGSCFT